MDHVDATTMRIAIIVPFLDDERYLPALLESLSVQTRLPDRVILVDDGSTDRSYDVAAAWAANRPNVDLIRRSPRRRQHVGFPPERGGLRIAG